MVKQIIICDSCGSEGGVSFIVGDGQYRHICNCCLSNNWSKALTGTPYNKEMLIIFDMLLGDNTPLYQLFSRKDKPRLVTRSDYEALFGRLKHKLCNEHQSLDDTFKKILEEDNLVTGEISHD